ncbi:MAG: hypothetical protein Q7S61_05430 [bacterium]|nr:hypothetical protein [bacterium]
MGFVAHNYSQSDRFGDETAHMIGGHFILKGKIPYTDMQFNHQPLNYIFSALVEKVSSPKNLYIYIARQREAIFIYGAVWNILYFVTFGPIILLFSLIFEISKYWYSGYKLLGETLAVYPTLYLIGIFIKIFLFKEKVSKISLLLFSISTFTAMFSLLPLWPLILFLNIMMVYAFRKEWQKLICILFPFVIFSLFLFLYISPTDFIKETIIYNAKYFFPASGEKPSLFGLFLLPFYSFIPPYTPSQLIITFFTFLFLFLTYFVIRIKRLTAWIGIMVILSLSNSRVANREFGSFHLLPWFASLLFVTILTIYYLSIKKTKMSQWYMGKIFYLTIIIVIVFIYFFTPNALREKKDVITENYINYSYSETYGRAIKILKDPNDRLAAIPNDTVVHWVADIDIATRILEYYDWVYTIPAYRSEIMNTFANKPPEFVIDTGLRKNSVIDNYIMAILKKDYTQLNHLGKPSNLYLHNRKYALITLNQWEQLSLMLYTKP